MTHKQCTQQVKLLKVAYGEAKKANLEKFMYEGNFMVTAYAKYLIKHLENELASAEEKPWFR